MTTQIATKAYCAEYWDAPDSLTVHVSDALRARIKAIQESKQEDVWSVNLRVPADFYADDEEIEAFQTNARFDVDYITIIGDFVCLFVQSKWDSSLSAEYEFNVDI